MSHAAEPQPVPTSPAPAYPPASSWVGWIAFAGTMMALLGAFHIVQGIVALVDEQYFVVARSGLLVDVGYDAWGWFHIISGVIAVVAGLCVFGGQVWARAVGVLMAAVSAISSVAFLSAYPLWSALIIVIDFVVIFALTVHGSEIKP